MGAAAGVLVVGDPTGYAFRMFSLLCVIVAGAYGAATVSPKILLLQALRRRWRSWRWCSRTEAGVGGLW